MDIQLNLHGQMLLEQFRERLPLLERLAELAHEKLRLALQKKGVYVTALEYRVKTEQSLTGKLELKGGKYRSIDDITDLVGMRIITFYTDDVDKVAAIVKNIFKVDWKESVDKRKQHELNSFGYNSLHYICRLPQDQVDDPRLAAIPFEMQMRTALQHVWSTIEHDTGYKSAVPILPEHRRQFSRLAGMLELIDDEFSRLRKVLAEHQRKVQGLVQSGKLDEVPLSSDSFRSFLELKPFDHLNQRIAAVNQAEIVPSSMMHFLPLMEHFGMTTLGDVQRFIDENSNDAYHFVLSQFALTDLDILSETVGIQNLCYVYALKRGAGVAEMNYVCNIVNGRQDGNEAIAAQLLKQSETMPFMNK
jgi:ppGpp synthetase/RelA/SpoT-type nucleotidyltranferase